MDRRSRITKRDSGWWFWSPTWKLGTHTMPGSWVGPFNDRDEAEGAMNSSDSDDAQAKWEHENPDEVPS